MKTLGAATAAVAFVPWLSDEGLRAFAEIQATTAPAKRLVLSPAQFATLEALVETIIPADEQSPGAKDARVADYIDLLLNETDDATRLQWMGGLAELDEEAAARFKRPFRALTPAQMEKVVAGIARNEQSPRTPVETFFVTVKTVTIQGYYTSEIGIHRELRYQGNKMLPEFVGCQTENGKDCPHCKQQAGRTGAAEIMHAD